MWVTKYCVARRSRRASRSTESLTSSRIPTCRGRFSLREKSRIRRTVTRLCVVGEGAGVQLLTALFGPRGSSWGMFTRPGVPRRYCVGAAGGPAGRRPRGRWRWWLFLALGVPGGHDFHRLDLRSSAAPRCPGKGGTSADAAAIAAAKKKNDRIDAGKIADCLRCDFLPECHMAPTEIQEPRGTLRYRSAGTPDGAVEDRVSGL